jgi:hypothetical protein
MIEKPSFESSAYGRIERVLLSIPSWVLRYQRQVEVEGTAALFKGVFRALNSNVQFIVVTHEEGMPHLSRWLREAEVQDRTETITVPNGTKLSVWAEDKFIVCADESRQRWLLHPLLQDQPGETMAAKAVAERLGWELLEVERSLQSGNVIVGDDFLLVGGDSASAYSRLGIQDTSRELLVIASRADVPGFKGSFESRELRLDEHEWREVCHRGNSENTVQPVFHIDAFMTLGGRGMDGRSQVVVGDPAMAAEALGRDLPDHAMRMAFDDIAEQLDQAGFRVIRNPLPLVYQDNHITKARQWYFASANNALVEIDGERKKVWLPTYGHGRWSDLEVIDRINSDIWEQLGFETQSLGDFHPFALNLGALRCMAKCLERST